MEADYVAIPELDTYDYANLDAREYGAMDFDARRAAEEEIARRYVRMAAWHDVWALVPLSRARFQPTHDTRHTASRTEQRGRLDDILDRYGDEDEEARDRRRGLFDQRRQQQQYMDQEGMEMVSLGHWMGS